ncbi:exonuclease SbcCD subunit D [Allonocardiopsis opalescens]|uniref:Nuclease SbcCD subunit D n=1 Tax=Allonocardiopsis opalescens TaxID=1144618 RepID=A0A2T0Q034_9ACTN|nr:exonuclease SbcCD subunit D [Allonocardiopsis opalescens]PRX97150.1 exodeoxyribonuclease I subunit D [Allonocardiopsis opalescens]
MRLLHTSDWHLGRSLHREDLLSAQGAFVDHLVETVRAERVDLVAVSGDLYDRALPPVDAVSLCDEALARLRDTGARVVVISGNHDSARRLGFGAALMDAAGVHLRTEPDAVGTPVLAEDAHGPVACYGIPYLEPELLRQPWELPERGHTAALTAAMDRVRADLARRPAGTRSVVLAHAFVSGGEPSDSERDISVGGASSVPAGVFAGADYTALGHLHGRQRMADAVRYSGSPLAYSFSEVDQVKGCWLVELDASGLAGAEFVPAPVPRRLARLRGRLAELLADPAHAPHEAHWLQVTLTDPVRPRAPMERLRARFPHTLLLDFAPEGGGPADDRSWTDRVRGRSETDLALDFVAWARETEADDAEAALVRTAFEDLRAKEANR